MNKVGRQFCTEGLSANISVSVTSKGISFPRSSQKPLMVGGATMRRVWGGAPAVAQEPESQRVRRATINIVILKLFVMICPCVASRICLITDII